MADQEITRVFQTIGNQLENVTSILGTQDISTFDGNSKNFKTWIESIEKYGMVYKIGDENLKLTAYKTSRGAVSKCIQRYLKHNPRATWAQLKADLKRFFGEIQDPQIALQLFRTIRQAEGENVHIYAERLLDLANEAYMDENSPLTERQLVGFFVDGLADSSLRMKVMRENPETLQSAIMIAGNEQNLRTRYNLRSRKNYEGLLDQEQQRYAHMEIDHLRPRKSCTSCKKLGHVAGDCRKRLRKINACTYERIRANRQTRMSENKNVKANIDCWTCGKLGHFSNECRSAATRSVVKNDKNVRNKSSAKQQEN